MKNVISGITKMVGNQIVGPLKWASCVTGADGCIYGIPCHHHRVIKFNPIDQSTIEIGPDLGPGMWKWQEGVLCNNGCIYSIRFGSPNAGHILKIDSIKGEVSLFNIRLPEPGVMLWGPGALGLDGCIYYMPAYARRILKFNPEDHAVTSVGDQIPGNGWKCVGTVLGNDGNLYGIPNESKQIVRFNVRTQEVTYVGGTVEHYFRCLGNGALGRDGCIYAADNDGKVLKIDAANDSYIFVTNGLIKTRYLSKEWGDAVLGEDGCIYWPPCKAKHTLQFDPMTRQLSLVGDELDNGIFKWTKGVSSSDGVVYCLPINANRILAIDPFEEFVAALRSDMKAHPGTLGHLFVHNIEIKRTRYDIATSKFGTTRVMEVIEKLIASNDECKTSSSGKVPSFLIAASFEKSAVSLIYYLLRKDPSWIG